MASSSNYPLLNNVIVGIPAARGGGGRKMRGIRHGKEKRYGSIHLRSSTKRKFASFFKHRTSTPGISLRVSSRVIANHASSTDIQKRLRLLISPDYGKCFRRFRPRNGENMKQRFDHLRRCKHGRISKENRSRPRALVKLRSQNILRQSWLDSHFEPLGGSAHAFRNYADAAAGIPRVIGSDLMDSEPVCSPLLLLDGSSLSYPHDSQIPSTMPQRLSDAQNTQATAVQASHLLIAVQCSNNHSEPREVQKPRRCTQPDSVI